MSQTAVSITATGNLILARLLAPLKSGVTLSDLTKKLHPFFEQNETIGDFKQRLNDELSTLESAGLIRPKPISLTERGREQALAFLCVRQLPARVTWDVIKNKYLVPLALRLPVDSEKVRKRAADADGLRAIILAREYDLQVGEAPTLNQAVDALAWKQLGVETSAKFSRGAVVQHLLGQMLGVDRPAELKLLETQTPAIKIGARNRNPEELRRTLIRRLAQENGSVDASPNDDAQPVVEEGYNGVPVFTASEPGQSVGDDLREFADIIVTLARQCPTGRHGDDRVFISHLWPLFNRQSMKPSIPLVEFKRRLLAAHRARLIRLRGADLTADKDPADLRDSAIETEATTYHYVDTSAPRTEDR